MERDAQQMKRTRLAKISFTMLCLIMIAAYFYPLPYYVSKPGMAKELESVVEVEGGSSAEGSFMLTTIQMGKANVYTYTLADWIDYWSIYKESDIRSEEETDEEYNVRQLYMMEGSKENAIISAYQAAEKPYEVHYKGVYVYNTVPGMPADGILQAGDRITKVDKTQFVSSEQFVNYISARKEGDILSLEINRNEKILEKEVKVTKLPDVDKVGIGIHLVDDISVSTTPKVSIDSEKIGGPSAGLMFSLEIYNQLIDEDITKGYKIAGTGTINEKGEVGAIGGIDQKVVAASNSGADIFFAPNEKGEADSNYQLAVETAKDINTSMEIVPVDTMEEALDYLRSLQVKK